MANPTLELVVKLRDEASKQLEKFQGKLEDLKPQFKAMAVGGAAAFAAVAVGVNSMLKAYGEAEVQLANFNTTLAAASKAFNLTEAATDSARTAILEASKAVTKLGFDDEQAAVSMARFFRATGDVEKATRLNAIAMDLARGKGVDLETATRILTLTLTGGTKEVKALGVEVDEAAAAWDNISKIEAAYTGQAIARSQTLVGLQEALAQSFANLKETIGGILAPAITELLKKLEPVIAYVQVLIENNPQLVTTIVAVTAAMSAFSLVVGTLGIALIGMIAILGSFAAPALVVVGATTAIIATWEQWQAFMIILGQNLEEFWEQIKNITKAAADKIMEYLRPVIDFIQSVADKLSNLIENIKAAGSILGSNIKAGAKAVGKAIGVKDAIIAPNGNIITTDPADYLIATKNPAELAGGGGVTINISGNQFLGREGIAKQIGDEIVRILKRDERL